MARSILRTRESLISSWTKGRLGERGAVEWAVKAMQRIRSELGQDTIGLLSFLSDQAQESNDLSPEAKITWRLLHLAANNRSTQAVWMDLYDLERKIRGQRFTPEDIDHLIDCMRPRLLANPLSELAKRDEGEESPLTWMSWEFKAACGSLDRWESKLGYSQIAVLPTPDLQRIVSLATLALSDALRSARDIGWITSERDVPNHLVHRVALEKEYLADGGAEEDPDKYNSNFAPIVRLLSCSFIVLLERDIISARRTAEQWRSQEGELFLRLTAFSMWHPQIESGQEVGEFLRGAKEQEFWRWVVFPEVASLRGLRWPDLPANLRSDLENRLWSGPNQQVLNWPEETAHLARLYHRDHEVARLVDASYAVPDYWVETVRSRRMADTDFPKKVGPIEAGLPGARAGWVPEGSGEKFRDVPAEELLEALAADKAQRKVFAGDDGEAFAKSLEGKGKILDALESANNWDSKAELGFKLLISYPDGGKDDLDYFRSVAERTARLAVRMPSTTLAKMADRLGYWLDAVDAHTQSFNGADELWQILLPHAEVQANSKTLPASSDGAVDEADLTTAALNEPFGHLVSYFLRRAPVLSKEDDSRLPTEFVEPLKKVAGRASELLANHMALSMAYFYQIDPDWLRQVVLEPMLVGGSRGNRLWEAFAKYSQIPPAEIWKMLEPAAFRQLSSQFLSPEARHNLAEMAVTVWAWSKVASNRYKVSPDKLRTALTLAKDDVRAAAAWRYLRLVESEKREDDVDVDPWALIGSAFFQEVWPLEAMLQSPATSKPLAAAPAAAGLRHFADAVRTVLTNLRPFEVWAISTEFEIDEDNQDDLEIIKAHPEELLRLLAACITEEQLHKVYDLGNILNQIEKAEPSLQSDPRMRQLRKLG